MNDVITINIPKKAFVLRFKIYDYMSKEFSGVKYRLMVDDALRIDNADERDEAEILAALKELLGVPND